jgi:hypothetical protein
VSDRGFNRVHHRGLVSEAGRVGSLSDWRLKAMGNQSGVIFGAVVIGFIVYIVLRGQLPQYLALVGI